MNNPPPPTDPSQPVVASPDGPLRPQRVLAIDDSLAILDDYRRILAPRLAAENDERAAELDDLEAELFDTPDAPHRPGREPAVELSTAASGEEGLALVEAALSRGEPFDVAFVDMRMPGGWDGLETIRHLFTADPGLQVVVSTAYSDRALDTVGTRFRRTDQMLILKKPFDAVEIRQAASALSTRRRVNEAAESRVRELDRRVQERADQIRWIALKDNLTGLPNREALLEALRDLVETELQARQVEQRGDQRSDRRDTARKAPRPGGFALLFLDFNRFKLINDSLGHEVGDQLLQGIAGRIQDLEQRYAPQSEGGPPRDPNLPITGNLTGYRLGGDEFVLVLEGVPCVGAAGDVALAAIDAFSAPHQLGPHSCVSHASIGLASSFREHLDAGELLRDADLAMFEAKAQGRISGRPGCVAFEGVMYAAAQRRQTLETDLRAALADEELALRYQPIRSAATASIVGLEALLSWVHPRLGRVDNTEIIRLAVESELIHPLGAWVRSEAMRDATRLLDTGSPLAGIPIHVNVSMRELLTPDFPMLVREELEAAGLPNGTLMLEVSEVGIDRQSDLVASAIHALHAEGLQVILDDFGRERSSLAFLAELPLRGVKIDRFFAGSIDGEPARLQVLQAIVGFAQALKLGTTACGIEKPEQLAAVRSIGVGCIQGYLMGRPLSLDELSRETAEHGFTLSPKQSRKSSAA